MRKMYLFLIPLILVSCMGRIKVVKDDFKNASVVTMTLKESSKESMIKGGGYATCTYSKEIQNNKVSPIMVGVHIMKVRNPFAGNQDLIQKGIIKVDDQAFDITLGETSAVNVTTISSQPNYATGGTQISSSQHEEWNTKFVFPKQMDQAIVNGNKVSLRMYFGTSPITFDLNVKKIKEFINATGEK